jgi:flagellar basal-body rod protein FlgB
MGDNVYGIIKETIDASALRHKVIANNIANINTKGFKRSEVVFEEKLKDEISKFGTDSPVQSVKAEVTVDNSTSMREDGNNVDMEHEMINLSANEIEYNTMIGQLNTKLGIMRYVINEGRK